MWQTLMDWLPDLRVGALEIRDLISLGVAALALYVAWIATQLGRTQTKLAEEQAAVTKAQAELLDTQHRAIMGSYGRELKIQVEAVLCSNPPNVWLLNLTNNGVVPLQPFGWTLLKPVDQTPIRVFFSSLRLDEVPPQPGLDMELAGQTHKCVWYCCDHVYSVEPNATCNVAMIAVMGGTDSEAEPVLVFWTVHTRSQYFEGHVLLDPRPDRLRVSIYEPSLVEKLSTEF